MPEAHLAAVAALTLALVVILVAGALIVGPPIVWQLATPPVLIPCGIWLRWAWQIMRQQHRLVAQWQARVGQARPATTPDPVSSEEQAQ